MWVFDPETLRFLDVNGAALDQYGYTREEFLALSLDDIRPPIRSMTSTPISPASTPPGLAAHAGAMSPAIGACSPWISRARPSPSMAVLPVSSSSTMLRPWNRRKPPAPG
ncbi:MAG: hypothetical protein M5U18_06255 [Dehalococcoidia bacterium]|nr:hypothetical protein [Dehalococcoidia bacterium]